VGIVRNPSVQYETCDHPQDILQLAKYSGMADKSELAAERRSETVTSHTSRIGRSMRNETAIVLENVFFLKEWPKLSLEIGKKKSRNIPRLDTAEELLGRECHLVMCIFVVH